MLMRSAYSRTAGHLGLLPLLGALLLTGSSGCDGGGNHPPVFVTIPQQTYEVGVAHNPLIISASDADGDPLTYTMRVTLFAGTDEQEGYSWKKPGDRLPAAMGFVTDPDKATLTWDPLASQVGVHEIVFTVSDGKATDQEKITVTVLAGEGGGRPEFLTPASYVLQLVQTDTITALVAVKDDDSSRVTLSVEGAPQGLAFKVVSEDGKRAEFSWTPTHEQIAAKAIYSFRVVAVDDGGNRAEQQIRIVIRLKDGGGPRPECPGEPPTIQHTPLRDQYGRTSYPLVAQIRDDGRIARAFAMFVTGEATDLRDFQGAELRPVPGEPGAYEGELPNLTAAGGDDLTYHYYICAVDDDDAHGDECDHFWCVPEENVYTFVAHAQGSQQGCADDAREPNDHAGQAVAVHAGTLPDLWLCPEDEDWFAVNARAGATLTASILFLTALGDLALELQDADGNVLARSATDSDEESVTLQVPEDGGYLLRVTGEMSPEGDGNGYSLTVALSGGGGSCTADPGEPNEDEAQATPLPRGSSGPYSICPGDIDMYRFDVQAGEAVEVTVRFTHADGDLDALLLDASGATLATSASADDDELLRTRTAAAGTLYLAVFGWQDASNGYELELSVGNGGDCPDFQQEPNETPDQATVLQGATQAAICNGGGGDDVDVYRIELPPFTGLRVRASFSQAEGDLDMMLLDAGEGILGAAWSADDDEEISFPGLTEAGPVYVRIYGYQHAEAAYTLSAELVPFARQCLPDQAEPNEEPGQAGELFPGEGWLSLSGLSLCGTEEDWFAVQLPAAASLTAAIDFPVERGALDLSLQRGETVLDSDHGYSGYKTVGASDLEAGRYLLRVISKGGAANLYTLQVMVQ